MYAAFKQYLSTLKLSPVSRKLYLSDVRRYLAGLGVEPTLDQVTSPTAYSNYLADLRSQAMAPSMLKRTLASLRQFGAFLSLTYSVPNPLSSLLATPIAPVSDYIKHFINYLNSEHLSPLTIKSYKSDMTRYLDWANTHLPSTKIAGLLSDESIKKYLNHLTDSAGTLPSTIERKDKSINRFKAWYNSTYAPTSIPDNLRSTIYDLKSPSPTPSTIYNLSSPLSSPDKASFFVKIFNSRKPFSTIYDLRSIITLGILLIFSASLGIFGYRQFSKDVSLTAAFPSTPITPNRQLSFQGRLENAAGTPITTATNLTFKLWDDPLQGRSSIPVVSVASPPTKTAFFYPDRWHLWLGHR